MVFNSKKLKPGASRGGPGRGSCPDPQRLCGDRTGQAGGQAMSGPTLPMWPAPLTSKRLAGLDRLHCCPGGVP